MSTTAPEAPPKYDLDPRRLRHGEAYPQDEFYASAAPFCYFRSGRGCGKSTTLIYDAVDYAEMYAGSTQLFTEPAWGMIERVALPILSDLYCPQKGRSLDWNESPPVDIRLAN